MVVESSPRACQAQKTLIIKSRGSAEIIEGMNELIISTSSCLSLGCCL